MVITLNNELIQLVTVKGYETKNGFKTNEDTSEIEIFAGVKSVGRTEYYEALRSGMNVSFIFIVDPEDFALGIVEFDGVKFKPSRVIYDGDVYLIRRTFKNNFGLLEMTCERME